MDGRNFHKELVSVELLRACEQQFSQWSGGTTTQLAIYPKTSEYKERNFNWRISTARVDSEQSVFTRLPGVYRILMILEGNIELTHEGIRSLNLNPFEQDEFEGGWTTKSIGRCTDFNLMISENSGAGKLDAVCRQSLRLFEQEIISEAWEAFYCLSAEINVTVNIRDETFTSKLNKGDFLLVHAKKGISPSDPIIFSHDGKENSPAGVRAVIYNG